MKLSMVIKSSSKLQQTSKVPIIQQCYDLQVSQIQPEGFFMSLSLFLPHENTLKIVYWQEIDKT